MWPQGGVGPRSEATAGTLAHRAPHTLRTVPPGPPPTGAGQVVCAGGPSGPGLLPGLQLGASVHTLTGLCSWEGGACSGGSCSGRFLCPPGPRGLRLHSPARGRWCPWRTGSCLPRAVFLPQSPSPSVPVFISFSTELAQSPRELFLLERSFPRLLGWEKPCSQAAARGRGREAGGRAVGRAEHRSPSSDWRAGPVEAGRALAHCWCDGHLST